MATIAIIQTGGKQYKVSEGDILDVEKIEAKEGDKITLPVLFVGSDKEVMVGKPVLKDAKVEVVVVEHKKAKKVFGVKHKAKKRQLKKFGHRQPLTRIKIVKIA